MRATQRSTQASKSKSIWGRGRAGARGGGLLGDKHDVVTFHFQASDGHRMRRSVSVHAKIRRGWRSPIPREVHIDAQAGQRATKLLPIGEHIDLGMAFESSSSRFRVTDRELGRRVVELEYDAPETAGDEAIVLLMPIASEDEAVRKFERIRIDAQALSSWRLEPASLAFALAAGAVVQRSVRIIGGDVAGLRPSYAIEFDDKQAPSLSIHPESGSSSRDLHLRFVARQPGFFRGRVLVRPGPGAHTRLALPLTIRVCSK